MAAGWGWAIATKWQAKATSTVKIAKSHCHFHLHISHKAAKSMTKLISKLYDGLQLAVCLSSGDGVIQRPPEHPWTSETRYSKSSLVNFRQQYLAELLVNVYSYVSFNDEKCVLQLCAWKPDQVTIDNVLIHAVPPLLTWYCLVCPWTTEIAWHNSSLVLFY